MGSDKFQWICIPDHVTFDALHLSRDASSGRYEFDWAPLKQIENANKGLVFGTESEITDLIVVWYANLRMRGYRHGVAEELLQEFGTITARAVESIHQGSGTVH